MRKGNRKFQFNYIMIIIVRIICSHELVEMSRLPEWNIINFNNVNKNIFSNVSEI